MKIDPKEFIEKADVPLNGCEEEYFYGFMGEKLNVVSDICLQIKNREVSQAHIYTIKAMLDVLVSCVDMKMDDLLEKGDL